MPTSSPPSPVSVHRPAAGARALPIVIDSPHSGNHYPADFRHFAPFELVRMGEDLFVDELYAGAPAVGATFIEAHFPRTYIDPNRTLQDLDTSLLDAPWPHTLQPGPKTALGFGLVWKLAGSHGTPMYSRKLSVAEVQARIDGCYRPYHQALEGALATAVQAHGAYWHLNVHSMPDDAYARLKLPEKPLADFVLGDLDGTTAGPEVMEVIETSLRAQGYSVARNDPFKGVDIIRRHGQPQQHRHSLQIEIKRSCYADVAAHQRNAQFTRLQQALNAMLQALASHVQHQLDTRKPAP